MNNKLVFTLICAFLSIVEVFSQSQFPPQIKWKEINTDYFNVIFPEGFEEYSKSTAAIIDSIYKYDTKSYMLYPPKINLVLYNGSAVSNAYAMLAPRKMQWYLYPPSSPTLTLQAWNEVLAIHEFRHVTQYYAMNSGFTKIMSLIFGQYGQAAMISWSVPSWFFEGDAIFSETAFSHSGRGRMPAFSLPIRTIALTKQRISYEKALFGSYRTYYPNHYYLGYYMVSYVNRNFGQKTWNKVINRSARWSFWPYTFERSMKNFTMYNARKTYKLMMNEVTDKWTEQLNNLDVKDGEVVNKKKKRVWTNYTQPFVVSEDTLLVVKSGYDNNLSIYYLTTDGKEKFISLVSDDEITYSKGLVAWVDIWTNPRFEEESYSDIVLYDLKKRKSKYITYKKRYLSPALNNKANKIAAVTFNNKMEPVMEIMDLEGNVLVSYVFEKYNNLYDIAWSPDDSRLAISLSDNNGLSLYLFDLETKTKEVVFPSQWIKFDRLVFTDDYLFFNYDYSGVTNIYAYKFADRNIYQVTFRPYSASNMAFDRKNNVIYLTDYTAKGADILKIPLDEKQWVRLENTKVHRVYYFATEKSDVRNFIKPFNSNYVDFVKENLIVRDYKRGRNLINIHSWSPYYDEVNWGYQVFSTNILNDFSFGAGFGYNRSIGNFFGILNAEYSRYYPVLGLMAKVGRDGIIFDKDRWFDNIDSVATYFETNIGGYVTIPLNLSKNNRIQLMDFTFQTSFVNYSDFEGKFADSLDFQAKKFLMFSPMLSYTYRLPRSYRQLRTPLGLSLVAGANIIPKIENKENLQSFAQLKIYLPGLMHNHSLMLTAGYEKKKKYDNQTYILGNALTALRSMANHYYFNEIVKFSADYALPLLYPDINIPYLIYIKRFRANLFFDGAYVNRRNLIYSYGVEIIWDFNILRFSNFTINTGLRFNFSPYSDLVLPVDFVLPSFE